jgi:putative transposase
VVSVLQRLADTRASVPLITVVHGPEFEGKAVNALACAEGVALAFIWPDDNVSIESLNGRTQDERLNVHRFIMLGHTRNIVELWRIKSRTERPNNSLGNQSPTEYARQCKEQGLSPRTPGRSRTKLGSRSPIPR